MPTKNFKERIKESGGNKVTKLLFYGRSSKMNSSGYGSRLDLSNSLTSSQFSAFGSPMSPIEDLQDVYRGRLQR